MQLKKCFRCLKISEVVANFYSLCINVVENNDSYVWLSFILNKTVNILKTVESRGSVRYIKYAQIMCKISSINKIYYSI